MRQLLRDMWVTFSPGPESRSVMVLDPSPPLPCPPSRDARPADGTHSPAARCGGESQPTLTGGAGVRERPSHTRTQHTHAGASAQHSCGVGRAVTRGTLRGRGPLVAPPRQRTDCGVERVETPRCPAQRVSARIRRRERAVARACAGQDARRARRGGADPGGGGGETSPTNPPTLEVCSVCCVCTPSSTSARLTLRVTFRAQCSGSPFSL